MRHTFQTAQWVPHPIEAVFAFFADPANLPRLMPPWQKAKIDYSMIVAPAYLLGDGPSFGETAAGVGSQITISFQPFPLFPLRWTWKAAIAEFEWNHHFCDEQPQGPFAYWRHCHHVSEEMRDDLEGTKIIDDLTYELPFGGLSEPAHSLFVRRQIEETFAFRQRRLLELLQP